jgi:hypothetical protein
MSFSKEASKLLTNKYFLYFMVFLAATNVLGYLVTNKINAVIFFALVSILTYQFSKNMAVILLVAVIATNFLMANKGFREGLENQSSSLDKVGDIDPEIANTIPAVKKGANNDEVKATLNNVSKNNTEDNSTMDINNSDLNKTVSEENVPIGVGEKVSRNQKGKTEEHFGPRLDYAATIEQSYTNLDNLLGSDSIQKLTGDTQKLMKQQQNLFNTMNQMVPVLEGAQNMLKNFNVGGLTESLKNIGGIANAPIPKL